MRHPRVRPKWTVVKLDETANWEHGDPEIVPRLGRIFGVYVCDRSLHVHCCEFTPSYELHFVESQFEGSPDDSDRLADYVMDGDRDTPAVCYVHCHSIDGLPRCRPGFLPRHGRRGGRYSLGRLPVSVTAGPVAVRRAGVRLPRTCHARPCNAARRPRPGVGVPRRPVLAAPRAAVS